MVSKECRKTRCYNPVLLGEDRCEDCWAIDQERYSGKPITSRFDRSYQELERDDARRRLALLNQELAAVTSS